MTSSSYYTSYSIHRSEGVERANGWFRHWALYNAALITCSTVLDVRVCADWRALLSPSLYNSWYCQTCGPDEKVEVPRSIQSRTLLFQTSFDVSFQLFFSSRFDKCRLGEKSRKRERGAWFPQRWRDSRVVGSVVARQQEGSAKIFGTRQNNTTKSIYLSSNQRNRTSSFIYILQTNTKRGTSTFNRTGSLDGTIIPLPVVNPSIIEISSLPPPPLWHLNVVSTVRQPCVWLFMVKSL